MDIMHDWLSKVKDEKPRRQNAQSEPMSGEGDWGDNELNHKSHVLIFTYHVAMFWSHSLIICHVCGGERVAAERERLEFENWQWEPYQRPPTQMATAKAAGTDKATARRTTAVRLSRADAEINSTETTNFKQRTFCKKTGTSSFLFECFFVDIFDVGAGTMAVGSETSLGRVGLLTMWLG